MVIKSRRDFLVASALTVSSFVVSTGFTGCQYEDISKASFDHGVASGDPLSDRVIIWTRLTPKEDVDFLNVFFEVATDENFENLVRPKESAKVTKESDFTLKVDFQNLDANTKYYYRFSLGNTYSPIGRMKTLATDAVAQVKLAVFSCANYPNGHFNAYNEAAQLQDLDATLHLGDYIYEYGMFESDGVTPAYATTHAQEYNRVLPEDNNTELLTLEDYRKRYALYHTDAGLQAIHAAAPMIAIWDDHEVANDAYKDGAQNHNDGEGDYTERKLAALQAYFEWLPIRPLIEGDTQTIYRSFAFGDLLTLHMLDTRIIGRDVQLSYNDFPELFAGDSSNFIAALSDPSRTMLGNEQTTWLQSQLAQATTTWDVLAQQVLMGRMLLPAELLGVIAQLENADEASKPVLLQQLNVSLTELYTIKMRINAGDPSVTPQEMARVYTAVPYNLDAWDGYGYNREVLLQTVAHMGKNLIVLSGDTHNAWANELYMLDGNYEPTIPVGVEFATTSVSSPGMEEYANLTDLNSAVQFETVIVELIENLKYFNANNRGFMNMTFTHDDATAEWTFLDSLASTEYEVLQERSKKLKTLVGNPTIVPA